MNYEIKRLDECCISISDGDHLPPPKSDSGVPFITISNIDTTNNTIDFSNSMFVPESYYDSLHDIRKAVSGDILYSVVGTFGVPVLIRREKKFVFQRHIAILRPNKNVVLPEYLYYVMKSGSFYTQADAFAIGSAQRTIGLGALRKMKASIPCIEDQAKAVAVLATYDILIEVNNKKINLLEQMVENLYKEWFVRFRFPGYETAEFENGIPKGWEKKRTDEAIIFNPTIKTGNQTTYTIIPMEALSTTSMILDLNSFVQQESISGKRSQNGDTLFAKITPCLENGKTGFVMGLPKDEVFGGSTEFIVLRSKTLTPHYVYCLARSQYFRQTAILSMNGADGRQRVDEDKLKSTRILQPEKGVLNRFEVVVSPIFDNICKLAKDNSILMQQRNLLLPRLMSGKQEVM